MVAVDGKLVWADGFGVAGRHHFSPMHGEAKQPWLQLCKQAASEQDPQRLIARVAEINRLLEAKGERLKRLRNPPAIDSAD